MVIFFASLLSLILGYVVYGTIVAKIFGEDDKRKTPVQELEDGVDFVRMPTWKIFLIQLLNIAGVGPIFGPILGALYGPVALIWIATLLAIFMTVVVSSYLGYAKIGFKLPMPAATGFGLAVAILCTTLFFLKIKPQEPSDN